MSTTHTAAQKPAQTAQGASSITLAVDAAPPTVNHMYIARRSGGKALSDEAQTFRALVALAVIGAGRPQVPAGDLAFTLRVWFPTRRKSDLDNRLKAALDAAALALGFDDRRVARIIAERAYGPARCEMTLEVLS